MSASSFLTDLSLIVAAAAAGQELEAFRVGLHAAGEAGVTRRVSAPENSTVYVSEVSSTPGYDLAALVLHGRKRDLYLLQPHEQRLVLPNGLSVEVRRPRSNPSSGLLGWNKTQGGETRGYFLRTPAPGFDPWYSIRKHRMGYGGYYFSVDREPSGRREGEYVGQAGTLGLAKAKAEEDAQGMLQWVSAGMPTPRANSGMAPFGGPGAPAMFNNMSAVLEGEGPRRNSGGRLYHVVIRDDQTGMDTYLTSTPENHADAARIMSKQTPIPARIKHKRYLLVETADRGVSPSDPVPSTNFRRNLGDGPPPPPPIGNPLRANHHLSPGDQVSMGDFVGTVVQSVPGKYDDYTVRWETGQTEKVAGHKLRLLQANPALRDYFGAGRQTAREIGGALAQAPGELMGEVHKGVGKLHSGLKAMGARARAAAERVEAGRKCEPTPEEAIRALAQAHRVKLNPAVAGYRLNLGDGPPPPPPLALRENPYLGEPVRYPGSKRVSGRSVTETIAYVDTLLRRESPDLAQLQRAWSEVQQQRQHFPDSTGLARVHDQLNRRLAQMEGVRHNPASDGETGKLIHQVDVPTKGQVRVFDPRPKNLWYNIYITLNNGAEARYALHSGGFTGKPYWGTNGRAPAWALSALMADGFDWQVV